MATGGYLEEIACAALDCCYGDLAVLGKSEYDIGEIVYFMRDEDIPLSISGILNEIFGKGREELNLALYEKISEREVVLDNDSLDHHEERRIREEIEELEGLDPDYDMHWDANGVATSCWLDDEDVYRKYLADDIRRIERHMGFDFD